MLATPEPGTKEHILQWLGKQPADEKFFWPDPTNCACGRYQREHRDQIGTWWGHPFARTPLDQMNYYAGEISKSKWGTYGDLYDRMLKVWSFKSEQLSLYDALHRVAPCSLTFTPIATPPRREVIWHTRDVDWLVNA